MRIPSALLLSALGLLLAGCATHGIKGRFINLDSGEEILVDAEESRRGSWLLAGDSAAGRPAARGEIWEVRALAAPVDGAGAQAMPPGDTVYQGTGFLRDGDLIMDIEYRRNKGEGTAIGKATDNRGGRYQAIFWVDRKPRAPRPARP